MAYTDEGEFARVTIDAEAGMGKEFWTGTRYAWMLRPPYVRLAASSGSPFGQPLALQAGDFAELRAARAGGPASPAGVTALAS